MWTPLIGFVCTRCLPFIEGICISFPWYYFTVAEMAAILHHESWQRPLRPFFFCTPSKWRFINIYFKFNILKLELADQSRKKFQKEKAKIRFNWLVLGAACHINPCWPLSAPTSVHILKSAKKSLGFSPFCVIFFFFWLVEGWKYQHKRPKFLHAPKSAQLLA